MMLVQFIATLLAGGFALRYLRRLARPGEPADQRLRFRSFVLKGFILSYALALLLLPFWLGLRALLAPWIVQTGRVSLVTASWVPLAWTAAYTVMLMAVSVPFFVSVAAETLGLPSPGAFNVIKALRFARTHPSYFRYWGQTWAAWAVIGVVRFVVTWQVHAPSAPATLTPTANLIGTVAHVAALFPFAHFLGMWARQAMPPLTATAPLHVEEAPALARDV